MTGQPPPFEVVPASGRPERVCVDGRWYRVRRVLDGWVIRSRWWATDEQRLYARIETDGPVVEAYRVRGAWALSHILD